MSAQSYLVDEVRLEEMDEVGACVEWVSTV